MTGDTQDMEHQAQSLAIFIEVRANLFDFWDIVESEKNSLRCTVKGWPFFLPLPDTQVISEPSNIFSDFLDIENQLFLAVETLTNVITCHPGNRYLHARISMRNGRLFCCDLANAG
jgi:hypothetical protein